jgi:hypothetical protein
LGQINLRFQMTEKFGHQPQMAIQYLQTESEDLELDNKKNEKCYL